MQRYRITAEYNGEILTVEVEADSADFAVDEFLRYVNVDADRIEESP